MNWTKTVLIFQAVVTLILGVVFFMQVLELNSKQISELKIEVKNGILIGGEDAETVFIDVKERYSKASYILLIVGVIELLIMSRFLFI